MLTELLDYSLPDAQIAQRPASQRDGSRLLVLDGQAITDSLMCDWPELVPRGALVVLNDTQVIRARLYGVREPSGGKIELLLLEPRGSLPSGGQSWLAMGRASKPLRPGTTLLVAGEVVRVADHLPGGLLLVHIGRDDVEDWLEQVGRVPLPPYVKRADDEQDGERYQTVFAARRGAVAAPTAGLHLTHAMLERLEARGVEIGKLTLHVGAGTFAPVKTEDLDQHPMHTERLLVEERLVKQVESARERDAPVVAVGTTVVRALESARDPSAPGLIQPLDSTTQLLIQPGYRFSVVDALLTNFHAPRSTLLALVAAFVGLGRLHAGYQAALQRGYRFLSYGDAMWLPKRLALDPGENG